MVKDQHKRSNAVRGPKMIRWHIVATVMGKKEWTRIFFTLGGSDFETRTVILTAHRPSL